MKEVAVNTQYSKLYARALAMISEAQSIAVSGHTNPDGDALGSVLALVHGIRANFPDKTLVPVLADERELPLMYRFLPGCDDFVCASSIEFEPDLFISVDTPKLERLKDARPLFERAKAHLAFDHHPDMEDFAELAIKASHQASSSCMVADFFIDRALVINRQMAQCILVGIITDTGRFQYQNTTAHSLELAAKMVQVGADPAEIALQVYQSSSLGNLKLESVVAQRIRLSVSGRVAYSYVLQEDFDNCQAQRDEAEGLIDIVRRVRGTEFCLLLREMPEGRGVRGNLRSKSSVDIAVLARKFGGGGHAAAAGFTLEQLTVDEALALVIPELESL